MKKSDLKTITESLRAAVEAGDLGAIVNGVAALEGLVQQDWAYLANEKICPGCGEWWDGCPCRHCPVCEETLPCCEACECCDNCCECKDDDG